MKTDKFWIIIIAIFLVISCAAAIAVMMYTGVGNIACVYQGGEQIERINLDTVTVPYTITVETADGGYNTISVEQGRICVTDASCPDHVCIDTGWISDGVIPIVCLPNELVIQIEGKNSDGVDIAVQ